LDRQTGSAYSPLDAVSRAWWHGWNPRRTLLDSALAKPRNVFASAVAATLPRLAASYAFGLARNHASVDGNKRTALVVSEGFLRLNGLAVVSTPEEKYLTFLHLADGSLSEDELTAWLTKHAVPLRK
jgi:death-on-curing protein